MLMRVAVSIFIVFSVISYGWSQGIPESITYQGKLTDSSGVPVPDGQRSMQFKLFNAETAGTQLWDSGAMNIVTTGGIFSVALGATPTPPITSSTLTSDNIWIEVTVGADLPLPRNKFSSVPFALRAGVANSVVDNSISSAKIVDGEVKTADLGQDSVTTDKILNETIQLADIGQNSASANQVIKRNSSNTAWVSTTDNDTKYTAGTGLSLSGTVFSLSTSYMDGSYWALAGNAGTDPSVDFIGTSDANALELKVNSSRALRIEPTTSTPNLVGGYMSNAVTADVRGAFIGGGGNPDDSGSRKFNTVTDDFGAVGGGVGNRAGNGDTVLDNAKHATVGGGQYNEASGSIATVGGGWYNRATYERTTIGGGWNNLASNHASTVGGGRDNTASGAVATVPGGAGNRAQGNYSFAAGRRAKADHQGTFVWADSTDLDFVSTGNDQFLIRASGGVGIGTASLDAKLHVASHSGKAIYGKTTNILGTIGYGIYGEASYTDGIGAYGANVTNNTFGYLGGNDRGVHGESTFGNYGYLGGNDNGAYGQNSVGNYGFMGGRDCGAYAQHSGGNSGSLGGSDYGVRSDGDLIVTGAYRGDIGPNNGSPFPRPAYDSGWISLASGDSLILNHNIGINQDRYVVDMQMKDTSYHGISNYHVGGEMYYYDNNVRYNGSFWSNLTSSNITVLNQSYSYADYVRIRIWVYK